MKCILMNKDNEVLYAEYDTNLSRFDKIYEVIDINYAPLILKNYYDEDNDLLSLLKKLENWFKNRGIPSYRDKLDIFLQKLNIDSTDELLNMSFGLSLSDQYWLKPLNLEISYDEINFFDHNFDSLEFIEATFLNDFSTFKNDNYLKTPNNTTDGMLQKSWIVENDVRYLLKGGYKNDIIHPFNEVLASMICERLNFYHTPYTIEVYKNNVLSKCPCFITKDTEYIPASQIRTNMKRYDNINDYEEYINILEKHNIKDARIKLENMFILDYLIMNEDRHLNNFGIIRNVNTLEWVDVAPIFDCGQSLNVFYFTDNEIGITNKGKFFYLELSFDEIIKVVKDIKRIDIKKLDGVVNDFDLLLHKYQNISHMSDKRIHILCVLLNRQIEKLRNLIDNV